MIWFLARRQRLTSSILMSGARPSLPMSLLCLHSVGSEPFLQCKSYQKCSRLPACLPSSGTRTVLTKSAHQPYRPVSMVLLVRCMRMQPIQTQVDTHSLSTTAAEDNVTVLPAAHRSSSLVVSAHRVQCCPRRASGLQPYPTAVCAQ